MEQELQTNEIDLMYLIHILFKKWYIIFSFIVLSFILAFIYAYQILDDEYTAHASIMVLVSDEEQSNEQNFNFSSKLVKTYTELAKSNMVIDQVIEDLNLEYSQESLRKNISVSGVQDTIIIKLSFVSDDAKASADIVNQMVEVMRDVSMIYEGFDNIEVLDAAQIDLEPSGPNRLLYLFIGIIIGGILGVGVILISEMMDKKIKTHKDIEQKLGLRVLATIPEYDIPEENHEF